MLRGVGFTLVVVEPVSDNARQDPPSSLSLLGWSNEKNESGVVGR